jgi:hypothetical protein
MSVAETKRRGRPAKAVDETVADVETEEAVDAPPRPTTPPCPRCGRPVERSTTLLRAYGMTVQRCKPCHEVAIEGDDPNQRYDIDTAISGRPPLIASRAAALFASRRGDDPLPTPSFDGFDAAVASDWDDPRWTRITD